MPEKKHILLLIEDNPLLAGLYRTAFEKRGLEVLFAHDGESGLKIAKEKKPEIILLDILMPGIDGFVVLEQIKTSPEMKNTKVIVLTIVKDEKSIEKARELGASDYLIKTELKLNEIVERVLGHL
jgi:DNA-binding response OmpR family regulator